jgi:ribosome-binding ATPase YchF (GTP1/OBG family)
MALTLGIIGFPKSGKTTIFNTLTHSNAETSAYGTSQSPNIGSVKVPDSRLDRLTEMFIPKKPPRLRLNIPMSPGWLKGPVRPALYPA